MRLTALSSQHEVPHFRVRLTAAAKPGAPAGTPAASVLSHPIRVVSKPHCVEGRHAPEARAAAAMPRGLPGAPSYKGASSSISNSSASRSSSRSASRVTIRPAATLAATGSSESSLAGPPRRASARAAAKRGRAQIEQAVRQEAEGVDHLMVHDEEDDSEDQYSRSSSHQTRPSKRRRHDPPATTGAALGDIPSAVQEMLARQAEQSAQLEQLCAKASAPARNFDAAFAKATAGFHDTREPSERQRLVSSAVASLDSSAFLALCDLAAAAQRFGLTLPPAAADFAAAEGLDQDQQTYDQQEEKPYPPMVGGVLVSDEAMSDAMWTASDDAGSDERAVLAGSQPSSEPDEIHEARRLERFIATGDAGFGTTSPTTPSPGSPLFDLNMPGSPDTVFSDCRSDFEFLNDPSYSSLLPDDPAPIDYASESWVDYALTQQEV